MEEEELMRGGKPQYWLGRAARARARADGMMPEEARLAMLEVARAYERIADWVLRLQKLTGEERKR
jgi:hypothetical protein